MRILLVEDKPEITRFVETILADEGLPCTVVPATTVQDAIKAVTDCAPQLVLTNVDLAGRGDGLEVLEFLRRSDIPVLLFTAYTEEECRGYRDLAAGYIGKPFSPEELLAGLAPFLPAGMRELRESSLDTPDLVSETQAARARE